MGNCWLLLCSKILSVSVNYAWCFEDLVFIVMVSVVEIDTPSIKCMNFSNKYIYYKSKIVSSSSFKMALNSSRSFYNKL